MIFPGALISTRTSFRLPLYESNMTNTRVQYVAANCLSTPILS
jgi:hypothetical protein